MDDSGSMDHLWIHVHLHPHAFTGFRFRIGIHTAAIVVSRTSTTSTLPTLSCCRIVDGATAIVNKAVGLGEGGVYTFWGGDVWRPCVYLHVLLNVLGYVERVGERT